jgi:predicted ester cyclase
MTPEQNKAVVRRWIEEFKTGGDESVSDELRSPHFVNHSAPPGAPTGPEAGKLAFRAMRAAFPDLRVTIEDMLADRDQVATRQTFAGTHRGEWLGVPPTGRLVSWAVIDIVRLDGNMIVDHWAVADLHGQLAQLTAQESP